MEKVEEIENIGEVPDDIKENIIDIIFGERDEDLNKLTDAEKEENKDILEADEKNGKDLENALKNLPECLSEVSNSIKECLQRKMEGEREILGYYVQKYYKAGFSDAIHLIFNDCKKV